MSSTVFIPPSLDLDVNGLWKMQPSASPFWVRAEQRLGFGTRDPYSPYFGLRLPDDIVVHIFSYLGFTDRMKAAGVCRQWYRVFFEQTLWRSVTWTVACQESCTPKELEQRIINFSSSCLMKTASMNISFPPLGAETRSNAAEALHTFLTTASHLSTITIHTVKFRDIAFHRRFEKFDSSRYVISATLSVFFEAQQELKTIGLANAEFDLGFGPIALNGLTRSLTLRNLKVLDVSYLCWDEAAEEECSRTLLNIADLCTKLREITINYSFLRTLEVDSLCTKAKETLQELHVVGSAERDSLEGRRPRVVDQAAWASALEVCPQLKVSMVILTRDLKTAIPLIVPGLPLVSLTCKAQKGTLWFPTENIGEMTGSLLNRLGVCCSLTLEEASIDVTGDNLTASFPRIASLVNFFVKCGQLRSLELGSNLMRQDLLDQAANTARMTRPVHAQLAIL